MGQAWQGSKSSIGKSCERTRMRDDPTHAPFWMGWVENPLQNPFLTPKATKIARNSRGSNVLRGGFSNYTNTMKWQRDYGLTIRVWFTMFLLLIVYLIFIFVLAALGVGVGGLILIAGGLAFVQYLLLR